MKLTRACVVLSVVSTFGCSSEETPTPEDTWSITSPAFASGAEIPKEYTCDGRPFPVGTNPQLDWTDGPSGTKSYALVLKHLAIVEGVDPTSPDYAKGFMWVVWDIPANVRTLPASLGREALPPQVPGAQQWAIRNQFGYFAPCPNADPASATRVTDRYGFTLYALNTEKVTLPAKEESVANYALTLTKHLDAVNVGTTELRAVSSAMSSEAPVPVDMAALVYPAGTTP
jgi:phosphatidylethanolamine-binding protein (PEBP) family uncharacterized protein